jgi:hypothetical protein
VSEWGSDVVNESHKLSDAQVNRLLKMTECLRDEQNMEQVLLIKSTIAEENDIDYHNALML